MSPTGENSEALIEFYQLALWGENAVTVFVACEPHACQAEELPTPALRNKKCVMCHLEKTNNQTEN